MKIDTTKILLIIVILMMGYSMFFKDEGEQEQAPVTVTFPESFGTTGLQTLEPRVVVVQVPVSRNSDQKIDVDAIWKEQYEKASQRIKDSLYNEAIRIRKYSDTIVNNDDIVIKGDATARGSILDFKVDYEIKEREFDYIPETISEYPRLTIGLGLELGIPTRLGDRGAARGNLSLMNKKGNGLNFGYDTNGTAWVGYEHNFKIIK